MPKTAYLNGEIMTVNPDNEVAEGILVEDGWIMAVGSKEDILALADKNTEIVDLDGKTMLPGFIDPHGHITAIAQTLLLLNFSECSTKEDVLNILQDKLKHNPPKPESGSLGLATTMPGLPIKPTRQNGIWIPFLLRFRFSSLTPRVIWRSPTARL